MLHAVNTARYTQIIAIRYDTKNQKRSSSEETVQAKRNGPDPAMNCKELLAIEEHVLNVTLLVIAYLTFCQNDICCSRAMNNSHSYSLL